MKDNPDKIVIMRTDRIGEVLLSTVVLDSIANFYPAADIFFLTSEYSRDILEDRKNVSGIMTVDTINKGNWIFKAINLAMVLRRRHFDMAVILNPHKVLHLASFLAGIPLRAGYSRKWGILLNRTIKDERENGSKYEIEYAMDIVRMLGIKSATPSPHLNVSRESEDFVENFFRKKGIDSSKTLVVVHPASSNPAKMWHNDRYAELIKKLQCELGCLVAVTGSLEERPLAKEIIDKSGENVLNLAGKFNLRQLAAFLKKSALFIGNDTGPMHMAAALNIPVIAIFGRNIPGVGPRRWRPWGNEHIVFHETAGCEKCYDRQCPYEYKCLKAVTVESVFDAAKRIVTGEG